MHEHTSSLFSCVGRIESRMGGFLPESLKIIREENGIFFTVNM